jgi:hypothetical protein
MEYLRTKTPLGISHWEQRLIEDNQDHMTRLRSDKASDWLNEPKPAADIDADWEIW